MHATSTRSKGVLPLSSAGAPLALPFTKEDEKLLTAVCAAAAEALQKARLLAQHEQSRMRAEAMSDLVRVVQEVEDGTFEPPREDGHSPASSGSETPQDGSLSSALKRSVSASVQLTKGLRFIVRNIVLRAVPCARARFVLVDAVRRELALEVSSDGEPQRMRVPIGQGLLGHVA